MPRPTAPLLLALLGGGAAAHAQGAAEPLSLSLADAWALALR
jgi:hypothetical protein